MTTKLDMTQPGMRELVHIVNLIQRDIKLEESDQVLILMLLDSKDKRDAFVDWIETKIVNEKLKATPAEVMHQVSLIGKD